MHDINLEEKVNIQGHFHWGTLYSKCNLLTEYYQELIHNAVCFFSSAVSMDDSNNIDADGNDCLEPNGIYSSFLT